MQKYVFNVDLSIMLILFKFFYKFSRSFYDDVSMYIDEGTHKHIQIKSNQRRRKENSPMIG